MSAGERVGATKRGFLFVDVEGVGYHCVAHRQYSELIIRESATNLFLLRQPTNFDYMLPSYDDATKSSERFRPNEAPLIYLAGCGFEERERVVDRFVRSDGEEISCTGRELEMGDSGRWAEDCGIVGLKGNLREMELEADFVGRARCSVGRGVILVQRSSGKVGNPDGKRESRFEGIEAVWQPLGFGHRYEIRRRPCWSAAAHFQRLRRARWRSKADCILLLSFLRNTMIEALHIVATLKEDKLNWTATTTVRRFRLIPAFPADSPAFASSRSLETLKPSRSSRLTKTPPSSPTPSRRTISVSMKYS